METKGIGGHSSSFWKYHFIYESKKNDFSILKWIEIENGNEIEVEVELNWIEYGARKKTNKQTKGLLEIQKSG